jgi:hypothetical protein
MPMARLRRSMVSPELRTICISFWWARGLL